MRPPVNNGIDAPTVTVQLFTNWFQFGTTAVGNATRPYDVDSVRFGRYSDFAMRRCACCAGQRFVELAHRGARFGASCRTARTIESVIAKTIARDRRRPVVRARGHSGVRCLFDVDDAIGERQRIGVGQVEQAA